MKDPRCHSNKRGRDADVNTNTILGILTMMAAMIVIPLVDGIAKYLSADYSPFFISWARYAVASGIVLPLAWIRLRQKMFPCKGLVTQTLRTVFLVTAMTLYFHAIAKVPLTLALSAYFVGPIITLLLSMLFLKEQITLRKIVALGLGFVGTLVILRPEGALNPSILLAFVAGFFFALYLIVTRMAATSTDPLQTLAFQCGLGMILLSPQAALSWGTPQLTHIWLFLGLGLFSALGHVLSIVAFRFAEASTLAPLVYVEILATSLIGYLVFSEIPDGLTIIGGCFIIAGGLITLRGRSESSQVRVKISE